MYLRLIFCAAIICYLCLISTNAVPAQLPCEYCRQKCAVLNSEQDAVNEFLQDIKNKHKRAKKHALYSPVQLEYDNSEPVIWDRRPIYEEQDNAEFFNTDHHFEIHTDKEHLNIVCKVQDMTIDQHDFESESLNRAAFAPDRVVWQDDAPVENEPEFHANSLQLMDHKDIDGEHNCPIAYFEESLDATARTTSETQTEATTEDVKDLLDNVTLAEQESKTSENITENPRNKKRRHNVKSNIKNCGSSINQELPNGNNAAAGQFPWIVRIAYRNMTSKRISYRCSGSMINDETVLTAAHCVQNLVADLQLSHVLVGDNAASAEIFQINKVVAHPSYDEPKYANDIALIFIKNTRRLPVVCLPLNSTVTLNEQLKTKTSGIFAGWSANEKTEEDEKHYNGTVQFIRLSIVNNSDCSEVYDQFSENAKVKIIIRPTQLCAISDETEDVCQGDSGGPFMDDGTTGIYNSDGRYTIVGVVAFGLTQPGASNITCGALDFPTVYTRVSTYTNWILRELYKNSQFVAV